MKLCENIQAHRKKLNISQEDLGKMLFVSRQTVSMWETGQTQPTIDNLVRLSEIFSVTVDELLSGEQNSGKQESTENSPNDEYSFDFTSEEIAEMRKNKMSKVIFIAVLLTIFSLIAFIGCVFDNAPDVAVFFLIFTIISPLSAVRIIILNAKRWKKDAEKMAKTTYKYEFYADYFTVTACQNGEMQSFYKRGYDEIKKIRETKNCLLLEIGQIIFPLRKSDVKNSMFLSEYARNKPEKVAKSKKEKAHTAVSITLFVLGFASLFIAMMLMELLVEVNGTPPEEATRFMWTFFVLSPVPLSSLVFGIVAQANGYKSKKNIIGGAIMLIVHLLYGAAVFIV